MLIRMKIPSHTKAPVTGKVRFSARAKEVKAAKVEAKQTKAKEKALATPAGPSSEETAAQKTQAAPLGLNGDTAKKVKKKKVKGEAKERLQQKPKEPAAPAPEPTPYRTPKPDAPSSDGTALPSATSPAPGITPQGDPTPAVPTAAPPRN